MDENYGDKSALGKTQNGIRNDLKINSLHRPILALSQLPPKQHLLSQVHKYHLVAAALSAPWEICVRHSENSFPLKEIGTSKKHQNPNGKDYFLFSFYF